MERGREVGLEGEGSGGRGGGKRGLGTPLSTPSFMVVLVTCKNKEEPIKNEGVRVVTRFSPL